jgi:prefoldin beta subunit
MSETPQEKINELQMAEQAMQSYLQQKQTFQAQQLEIESALKELGDSDEAYKIVGNIMVKSSSTDLKKELESKKELVSVRLKAIEKQENSLKEKTQKLQEDILKNMTKK